MKTVRTTFFPNQKNRTVYFDAEEVDSFFEKENGHKPTARSKELHRYWAIIVNAAYDDGFRDAIEETLEKAVEGR